MRSSGAWRRRRRPRASSRSRAGSRSRPPARRPTTRGRVARAAPARACARSGRRGRTADVVEEVPADDPAPRRGRRPRTRRRGLRGLARAVPLAGVRDHVRVREDVAVLGDDEAGALGRLRRRVARDRRSRRRSSRRRPGGPRRSGPGRSRVPDERLGAALKRRARPAVPPRLRHLRADDDGLRASSSQPAALADAQRRARRREAAGDERRRRQGRAHRAHCSDGPARRPFSRENACASRSGSSAGRA